MEFGGKKIPKRYVILGSFSEKVRSQAPWRVKNIGDNTEGGGVINTITDFEKWNLDSSDFYLRLEDKLRKSKYSYNNKKFKLHYQTVVRILTTASSDLTSYEKYEVKG